MVYETIRIKNIEERFIALDIMDFPVELVSSKGRYYMLYIRDDETGELWFLIEEIPRDTLMEYIKGKLPVEHLFEQGTVTIVRRPYARIDEIEETSYSIKDFKLPSGLLEKTPKEIQKICQFIE